MVLRLIQPLVVSPFVHHHPRRCLSHPSRADLIVLKACVELGQVVVVPDADARENERVLTA
jgi:hypothetical protein